MRYIAWIVGSAVYWTAALYVVVSVTWSVGGDCSLEQSPADIGACLREQRWFLIVVLAAMAMVYVFGVRAVTKWRR